MMIVIDGAACELRGFRLKQGIGFGETMRVTHFAVFRACLQCPPTRCGCRLPDTIPMLCGTTCDSWTLDEITLEDPAAIGMPDFVCQVRAAKLATESTAAESSGETAVDGAAAESSAAMVVEGAVIARDTPLSSPRCDPAILSASRALRAKSPHSDGPVSARFPRTAQEPPHRRAK